MTKRVDGQSLCLSLVSAAAALILVTGFLTGLSARCFAEDGPKPDPSGIATGDKKIGRAHV